MQSLSGALLSIQFASSGLPRSSRSTSASKLSRLTVLLSLIVRFMDYINIGTGVTTLRTETLVEAVMNLKLSGSDNISSYMAAISCLKSKALSIVLALLVKAWNRFKTGHPSVPCLHFSTLALVLAPSTSSYEYSRQHIVFGIMVMRKLKFTVLKNDMIASAQQVLAAVITAGASREHEILAEIRDAVFSFIRKMEPRRVMDTMLASRVRIFYIMSLLARHRSYNQLRFLQLSAGRSLVRYDSSSRNMLVGDRIQGFKVNIKSEKKSKLSSVVLKIRGIDQVN
ncbi:hypothetical protein SASPL_111889 [Salvia splendens]|uniref:Uncharacterized protein n=1 Tax=Salvia splendens TaxID=180675 RepID=A0A8X8Y828_SALSN|nr:hypothetical protein SASPL_111889 [Salvia splendens]